MLTNESPILEILEFLNLPVSTLIVSNLRNTTTPPKEGDCKVYLNYNRFTYSYKSISVLKYINNRWRNHNEYGAAHISFASKLSFIVFYMINGKNHRNDSPAIYRVYRNKIFGEEYFINNIRHNRVGPAVRLFFDGKWFNQYYLNGNNIRKNIFLNMLEKRINENIHNDTNIQ